MLLNARTHQSLWCIAKKECTSFFLSPIAYLFLAVFSSVTLFVFFWVEAFYARNIADVAPLFKWMPVLFIFLCSALSMRSWSEERRSGTIEHIFTQPVPIAVFVLGKFLGGLSVLVVALAITLPIPISVSIFAQLDWGPVFAGYLASLFLGAAYLSIGYFASSRTDNQIVALIMSVAVCSAFYFIGRSQLIGFFGQSVQAFLSSLSTSTRFEDITRGVIDLRDFYYFFSLIVVFLVCTVFGLERERWISQPDQNHHVHWRWATVLVVANILLANVWLAYFNGARIDTTEGKQYSLTETTENYLANLQEPLLIRGYFSEKTHPLLAPLVPQLTNLLQEYGVASRQVTVEIVDPVRDPELEKEAREKYAIEAVPFQLADRYQASIVSSYFNVLIQYGDEFVVLDYDDLIDVRSTPGGDVDVVLRNAEFDMTKSIKTVLQRFQSAGNIFDTINKDLTFTAYVSEDERLPESLREYRQTIQPIVEELVKQSGNRLNAEWISPEARGMAFTEQLAESYGFRPMATSLLDAQSFYFYLVLGTDEQKVQIPLGDLSEGEFERNLQAAVQRFSSGFTRTLAIVTPAQDGMMSTAPSFQNLQNWLAGEWNVINEDIDDGSVSGEADALWVVAPKALNDRQVYAIDQYLMQGGTVFMATSPYTATLQNRSLTAQNYDSGLQDWLAHNGVEIDQSFVMDQQSGNYPVPVTRNIGGLRIQDISMLPYPYFIDVRGDSLNQAHPIMAGLTQLNVSWASPIHTDNLPEGLTSAPLINSSNRASLSDSLVITPDTNGSSFKPVSPSGEQYLIATVLQGSFRSYFDEQSVPTLTIDPDNEASQEFTSFIEKSPASAKLVVFASNTFLSDQVLQLSQMVNPSLATNNLTFASNAVDWSLEDAGLMSIRGRSAYSQMLPPMSESSQKIWEYGNYAVAIAIIAIIGFLVVQWRRRQQNYWYGFITENKGGAV